MAVSTISRDIIVKTYSVTTASNTLVSPFGAYKEFTGASAPSGYAAVGSFVRGIGSTNPAVARLFNDNGSSFVYSRTAGTFTLVVLYMK